jgi:endoglucanase
MSGQLPTVVAHLDLLRDAGFDTVRLPVAWSHHASARPPFVISPRLFATVDEIVLAALERNLSVVVDVHRYDDLCANPAVHRQQFLALWTQIAERYADTPSTVKLELLNEPQQC